MNKNKKFRRSSQQLHSNNLIQAYLENKIMHQKSNNNLKFNKIKTHKVNKWPIKHNNSNNKIIILISLKSLINNNNNKKNKKRNLERLIYHLDLGINFKSQNQNPKSLKEISKI